MKYITSLVLVLSFTLSCLWSCSKIAPTTDASSYPDIGNWTTSPSTNFLLDNTDLTNEVSRTSPFSGSASTCNHEGAHLHFGKQAATTRLINVYAPADGVITSVDPCMVVGANDKYEIIMAFAKSNDSLVSLNLSLEPFGGYLCSGGVSGSDNGAFSTYILVAAGDSVTAGQLIAKMYVPTGSSDDTHIHFHLSVEGGGSVCPNIFDNTIADTFDNYFSATGCLGVSYTGTGFCVQPGSGEDLTTLD